MSVRSLAVRAWPSRAALSGAGTLGVVTVLLLGAVGSQAPAVTVNQAWTDAGATMFVQKPCEPDQLLQHIRAAFGRLGVQ